jgi:hypothetical protein
MSVADVGVDGAPFSVRRAALTFSALNFSSPPSTGFCLSILQRHLWATQALERMISHLLRPFLAYAECWGLHPIDETNALLEREAVPVDLYAITSVDIASTV